MLYYVALTSRGFLLVFLYLKVYPCWMQVLTVGALHHADASTLRAAAASWQSELAPLPKPLLIVNIGGPTSKLHTSTEWLFSLWILEVEGSTSVKNLEVYS